MAKKKTKSFKCLFSLLAVATAATVILSSVVLARYSTTAGGSGTSGIATWNVTITPQTNTSTTSGTYDGAFSFGKLSPGNAISDPSKETIVIDNVTYYYLVKNTSDDIKVASLTYTTSVDMKLVISSSDFTITFNDGSTLTNGTATGSDGNTADSNDISYFVNNQGNTSIIGTSVSGTVDSSHSALTSTETPCSSDITGLYELDYYLDSTSTAFTKDTTNNNDYYSLSASSTSVTHSIYATITWQIKIAESSYTAGDNYWATYLCDWVGKYVDNVSCTLTYSAQQNSET